MTATKIGSDRYLKPLVTMLPAAMNFALSPQGDEFWQDTLMRLDIYSKSAADWTSWESDYLKTKPEFPPVPKPAIYTGFYIPITKEFQRTLNGSHLSSCAAYLNEALNFAGTSESAFHPEHGSGWFWQQRHRILAQYAQDSGNPNFHRGLSRPPYGLCLIP